MHYNQNRKIIRSLNLLSKKFKSKIRASRRLKKKYNLNGGASEVLQKTFSLMTFNVELFLNLYTFVKNEVTNKITSATPDIQKIADFNKLFSNIDVACIQEAAIAFTGYTFKSTFPHRISHIDPIENKTFKKKTECQSHELVWDKSTYIYGKPSYLANAIYVKDGIQCSEYINTLNIINTEREGLLNRCYTSLDIVVDGKQIKIVSVHLTGGRFDDKKAILDEDASNEKLKQLTKVLEINPDIICGDFNTKLKKDIRTDDYFNTLMKEQIDVCLKSKMFKPDEELCKERWDRWIYIDPINTYLTSNGYNSVYGTDSIIDTNSYGGVVDMIYYKTNKLELVPMSVEIVGKSSVMTPIDGGIEQLYTPILSDHYPIKAKFKVL